MKRPRIVHLVDDTTAGGVMRVVDYLVTAPQLTGNAHHTVREVVRGALPLQRMNADLIVSHLSVSWRTLPALIALRAQNARIPLVHVEHSYTESFVACNVAHKLRFATLLRTAYSLFERVVAVSEAQGKWLRDRKYVAKGRLAVIRSCVDLSEFRGIASRSRAGRPRVLGAIGRLDPQKGFDTLIEAFKRTADHDLTLRIYGTGPQEEMLKRLAKGDPRIEFKGFCEDPAQPMSEVDAVLMPSRWEAYGLVAIEALSAGRPLVVNRIDGLLDHLPLGAQAAPDGSVSGWVQAIERLAASDASAPSTKIDELERPFVERWSDLIGSLTKERSMASASN